MKILGIHTGHNASACLLDDGKICAAIQEERLTRIKNHTGFPKLAVDFVLTQAGLSVDSVDKVAYTDVYRIIPAQYMERQAIQAHFSQGPSQFSWREIRGDFEELKSVNNIASNLRTKRRTNEFISYGIPSQKLCRIDHHTAHAASAYYGWGAYKNLRWSW